MRPALLTFEEACFERLWGGRRLGELLHKDIPAGRPVGEAWLLADHATYVSTVNSGPWTGRSLHDLVEKHGDYLLGTQAAPTVHGRFPLLLKILDAADVLSVQVHPDDEAAAALGEADVGKTEMWHVLEAEPGSELICGMDPGVDAAAFRTAIENNTVQDIMRNFPALPGTSAFVSAGTVHAIGGGILLAEIQQNSDLTYRIYDWDRVDDAGKRRELHLEKAVRVTHFGSDHGGAATPLAYREGDVTITVLGACRHFASFLYTAPTGHTRLTGGRSFHLILARDNQVKLTSGEESVILNRGRVALVPAESASFTVTSEGAVLDYFVPDLSTDIVAPLRAAGHADGAIVALGGESATSDIGLAIG